MSAVYSGRQQPSYEDEELSAMYRQAMSSLQEEEGDPNGVRTPVGTYNTPGVPRDNTPYGTVDPGALTHHRCP